MPTLAWIGLFGAVIALQACGDSPPDNFCDYPNACKDGGPGLDATLDAPNDARPPIDAPAGCDLTKDPKDSLPCIDDGVGVFVSPTGADTNPGTKASPVKTIPAALGKLGNKLLIPVNVTARIGAT